MPGALFHQSSALFRSRQGLHSANTVRPTLRRAQGEYGLLLLLLLHYHLQRTAMSAGQKFERFDVEKKLAELSLPDKIRLLGGKVSSFLHRDSDHRLASVCCSTRACRLASCLAAAAERRVTSSGGASARQLD